MECTCKLKVKAEFNTIIESEFLSKPVDLSKISENQIPFFADIFPYAFEKDCKCFKPKSYGKNGK